MGYLVKDMPAEEILAAIRSVSQGRKHFPLRVSEKLAGRLAMQDLSEREFEVLRLMAVGLSNKEIGQSLSISLSAVKYHVNNILGKLGAEDRTQAVVAALKKGLTELE
jgi:DNA-binding NarL/FixJ family response regulator